MSRDDATARRARAWGGGCGVVAMALGVGCWSARADDIPDRGPAPRSHIAPVGEIAASRPQPAAVAAPASAAATFGLHVVRVPDILRQHLSLGHGVGLVVHEVTRGSAAERYGFTLHDVLVSIDDQSLIVPEQLAVLLEGTGTSAPRSCTLIRNGARMTISLDTRPAPPAVAAAPHAAVAPAHAATATPAAEKRQLAPTSSALALLPDKKKARALAASTGVPLAAGVVRRKGDTGVVQEDLDYSIDVTRDEETRLMVRDARGKTIFHGAIETPEQRSRIPLVVRDRVEQLERLLDRQVQAQARPQPVAEIGRLEIEPVQIK